MSFFENSFSLPFYWAYQN